jgi:hypothetical protein
MIKRINLENRVSFATMLLLFSIIVGLRFLYPPVNVLSWDVFGYYLYLPAKFIYHDLGLTNQDWLNKLIAHYQTTGTLYQAYVGPSGQWVMKYSMGMAVLYMPFFFVSHWFAGILGFPADGLSMPYQYGLAIGGLFYTFVGLIFFRKILLKFFNDKTVTIVLVLTFLGTNIINQTTVGNLLSHNFLFTLFAAFVWYAIKWHENHKMRLMILMALISGLMTLIRPNEVVCLLIPLLWGVKNKENIHEKIRLFGRNKLQIFIGLICFVIVLIPQFYYWKRHTGSFIFYSYPNPGEGLDFFSPHLGNFLFSFRKGWIVYTPMVIFYALGLYILFKRKREVFYPVTAYLLISLYLISSWTCWWYAGGCYSQRAILSSYLVLSIGLGFFIENISKLKSYKGSLIYLILFFFVFLNLFQFWQFQNDILKHDGVTRKYYVAIFGKIRVPENASQLLLIDRSVTGLEKLANTDKYNKKIVGMYSFTNSDNSNPERYIQDPGDTSLYCLEMDSSFIYSPGLTMKYKNITGEYYAWIRASVEIKYPKNYQDTWPALVLTFEHNGGSYKYFAGDLVCSDNEKGNWKKISFDYMTPEVRSLEDPLKVYVWHRGKMPILIKNLTVEAYDPIIN